jgi:hypothetical protein
LTRPEDDYQRQKHKGKDMQELLRDNLEHLGDLARRPVKNKGNRAILSGDLRLKQN